MTHPDNVLKEENGSVAGDPLDLGNEYPGLEQEKVAVVRSMVTCLSYAEPVLKEIKIDRVWLIHDIHLYNVMIHLYIVMKLTTMHVVVQQEVTSIFTVELILMKVKRMV